MAEKKNIPTVPTAQVAARVAAMEDGIEHLTHGKDATIGIRNSYGNVQQPLKA